MIKAVLKSLVLGSILLAPALQAASTPRCPEKAFSALWDGLVWTVVTPNKLPNVNEYVGSCRLDVGKLNKGIGSVTGWCDTADDTVLQIPVNGVISVTDSCMARIVLEIEGTASLTLTGTLSGNSRDVLNGTFVNPSTAATGAFTFSKLK